MQDQLANIQDLIDRQEIKKAEVLIAKILRSGPTPEARIRTIMYRARVRLLSARPEDAIDDLSTLSQLDSDFAQTPEVQELLADAHFARFELASVGFADRADTAKALAIFHRILDSYPQYENNGWICYQIGRLYLTENKVQEAIEFFNRGLLSPSSVKALTAYIYERLGFIAFYETRNSHDALTFINKAIDTYPASDDRRWLVQVHILRSRILREMRRYDQALDAAETALIIASANQNDSKIVLAEALLTISELLAEFTGRERDVITHLLHFLQLSKRPLGVDVTWSRVHEMLGDAYFKSGQYAAATNAYQAALQFNPYHPWEVSLHFRIARSYYQNGEYERAITAAQRTIEAAVAEGQAINDYRIYDVLGNAHFALGNYEKALDAYRQALELGPTGPDHEKIKTYFGYAEELRKQT